MELETSRLILRPYTPEDFEDYFAYIMDRGLQYMLGLEGVDDRDCALANFQWLLDNREFIALVKKSSGKAIGHICVHPPYEGITAEGRFSEKKGASLSFAIATEAQRRGFMLEALQALTARMFQEGGYDYLDCEYTPFNTASAALQRKLGFQYWGRTRFDEVDLIINIKERDSK